MRVFTVVGITKSGKTTTIENIIRELRRRRYSVGSVKDIHYEGFAIDQEGTNTDRHHRAGSELVTALGLHETDVLFKRKLGIREVLGFYDQDFVVLEGVDDFPLPKIITAYNTDEVEERLDAGVFAVSGRIANEITEYRGLPVIDSIEDVGSLVDLIEDRVFEMLPNMPAECCDACGLSCEEMMAAILRGEREREDCLIGERVRLWVGDERIEMVPFVQDVLANVIEGVVRELDGYRPGAPLQIRIGHDDPAR